MLSPIAKALHKQTPAERLDATIWTSPFPEVAYEFGMLMLSIAVKLQCGALPGQRARLVKGGEA